jgi:hypothetical protein
VFLPPAFIWRLPLLTGHAARRAITFTQRAAADAASLDASEAFVKLAPVLAAGVLVGVPVAAVTLAPHGGPRVHARAGGAEHPAAAQASHRPHPPTGLAARATRARAGITAAAPAKQRITPVVTQPHEAEVRSGALAGSAASPAQASAQQRIAAITSTGAPANAPAAVAPLPGASLGPGGAPLEGQGGGAVAEHLAPPVAGAQAAGQSAGSAAQGLQRAGVEQLETLSGTLDSTIPARPSLPAH